MTTTTMNALHTSSHRAAPAFKIPASVKSLATRPDMPITGSIAARTLEVVSHAAVAAVPFGAIAWMFLAH